MKTKVQSVSLSSVKNVLQKRRKLMFPILLLATLVVFTVNALFDIKISDTLEIDTQRFLVYVLISYKIIELFVIYQFFYSRHLKKYRKDKSNKELLSTFEKNGKRFFMLVAQGNIVFGVISFKLLANPLVFLLFMFFAITALVCVQPIKIVEDVKNND